MALIFGKIVALQPIVRKLQALQRRENQYLGDFQLAKSQCTLKSVAFKLFLFKALGM